MKVLIAPCGVAGALTAAAAAERLAEGWRVVRPRDDLVLVPLSIGGAGMLDAVAAARGDAERVTEVVADACGRARHADWLRLADGRAVVEAAEIGAAPGGGGAAPGVGAVPGEVGSRCDAMTATSYGVGQLVAAAVGAGAREVIVGCGDGPAVDGGAGLATALGHRLLRADGNGVKVGGRWVGDVRVLRPASAPAVPVTAALAGTEPLLGPAGAARAHGPRLGAGDEEVELVERALTRLADVVERDLPGGPWRAEPGAGAGGGLGFGLLAFCAARPRPAAGVVAELVGFDQALEGARVVVTGAVAPQPGQEQDGGETSPSGRARAAGALVLPVTEGARSPDGTPPARDGHGGHETVLQARGAELAATVA